VNTVTGIDDPVNATERQMPALRHLERDANVHHPVGQLQYLEPIWTGRHDRSADRRTKLRPVPTREQQFNQLYTSHAEAVRRYVWRRDSDFCDDVLAETFLVAWRRLEDTPADARPWLIGIARNIRLNLHRSARRQQAVSARLIETHADSASAETANEANAVTAALSKLSHADREVLLLSTWDALDRNGIAQALGCSTATVSVRLHRARKRFAAALTEDPTENPSRPLLIPRGAPDVQ
jgi:RNA polymerase sigma-70 factor, ECF subfamily